MTIVPGKRPAKFIAVGWFPVGDKVPAISRIWTRLGINNVNIFVIPVDLLFCGPGGVGGKVTMLVSPRSVARPAPTASFRPFVPGALLVSLIRFWTLRWEHAHRHVARIARLSPMLADSFTHCWPSAPHRSIHTQWLRQTMLLGPRLTSSIAKIRRVNAYLTSYVASASVPQPCSLPRALSSNLTCNLTIELVPGHAESGRVGKASR